MSSPAALSFRASNIHAPAKCVAPDIHLRAATVVEVFCLSSDVKPSMVRARAERVCVGGNSRRMCLANWGDLPCVGGGYVQYSAALSQRSGPARELISCIRPTSHIFCLNGHFESFGSGETEIGGKLNTNSSMVRSGEMDHATHMCTVHSSQQPLPPTGAPRPFPVVIFFFATWV